MAYKRAGRLFTMALADRRAMVMAPPFRKVSKSYLTEQTGTNMVCKRCGVLMIL